MITVVSPFEQENDCSLIIFYSMLDLFTLLVNIFAFNFLLNSSCSTDTHSLGY